MESKYKERAKELLKSITLVDCISEEEKNQLIQAMCQLAKEIETESYIKFRESVDNLFTREQIEEFLEIQRKLSLSKLRVEMFGKDVSNIPDYWWGEIILNAKLKIG